MVQARPIFVLLIAGKGRGVGGAFFGKKIERKGLSVKKKRKDVSSQDPLESMFQGSRGHLA